jgi:hypothetical protein
MFSSLSFHHVAVLVLLLLFVCTLLLTVMVTSADRGPWGHLTCGLPLTIGSVVFLQKPGSVSIQAVLQSGIRDGSTTKSTKLQTLSEVLGPPLQHCCCCCYKSFSDPLVQCIPSVHRIICLHKATFLLKHRCTTSHVTHPLLPHMSPRLTLTRFSGDNILLQLIHRFRQINNAQFHAQTSSRTT